MDINTMYSLGNYGTVYIKTHGGILPAKSDNRQTALSSGFLATDENRKAIIKELPSEPEKKMSIAGVDGVDYILYTTEFFKGIEFSDTLFLIDACNASTETGTPGGDLASAIDSKGGTMVGFSGNVNGPFANFFFLKLAQCLKEGKTVSECKTAITSDPYNRVIAKLAHIINYWEKRGTGEDYGHFSLDNIHVAGDQNYTFAGRAVAGTYTGTFSGTTTETHEGCCSWQENVSADISLTIIGSGTSLDPFFGAFDFDGYLVASLLFCGSGWECLPEGTFPMQAFGTVYGSSGVVEAEASDPLGACSLTVNFTGASFSGSSLYGTMTADAPPCFDAPIVTSITLTLTR